MSVAHVDENITFELCDIVSNNEEEFIDNTDNDDDLINSIVTEHEHYTINFTIKQLLLICDYYGLSKTLKTNKKNKEYIINVLVCFEKDYNNQEIVFKRRNMWYFMAELNNDKFMKKYIIW